MKNKILRSVTIFITLSMAINLLAQECMIKEENWTIKTYPFSEPDPIPILVKNPRIYPYFAFNRFSHTSREQTWKVVRLENPYIQVFVLPEVGGKIYGAIEKSTRKEFIYLNRVLKFRQIAMRGPWTSGGIEFSFGVVGHTPAAATPVDYLLRENPDGSVSCIVGTMDLPSRTRWNVTITLPGDKATFETRALWYNPSPFHQSYYSWMNDAVRVSDGLQYFYPGRFVVPHSSSIPLESWPVDKKGRALSWYKNNNFGADKSHFILGEYEHYYGGYWHDSQFGFGHWALYDDMPGKKMWIWALSRQGAIWEKLLTDTDGQYSEPQAGRLFSQVDHEFFTPYTGDVWRELWFPFKEIGGLVKATPYAALNVTRNADSLMVGICALQALEDALVITIGSEEIYHEPIALKPMEVQKKTFFLPPNKGTLQISIDQKLYYTDDPQGNDIHRPINYHRFDENTTEGLYLAGEYYEKQRRYDLAMKKYQLCLEREPLHTRALTRVAELYCRRTEYEKGLELAALALNNVMYDPDVNYVYGIISRYLGNLVDAKETLGWAARSMKYRSSAYCQIAEIYIQEKNFDLALEYTRRALDFNSYNLRAYEVMAIIHRKLGQLEQATAILTRLLELDPLNHLARFERYLLEPTHEKMGAFKFMILNELPHENFLEMAISYVHLGLEDEAVTMLEQAPSYPTVNYWLAYLLRGKSFSQSQNYLRKAQKMSPRLVFPFRQETMPVFQWAIETQPADWKAKYYLGLIYWGKGRVDEAHQFFAACGEPEFAPFYLTRGHLSKRHDSRNAIPDFTKALAIDDQDWRNWHYLINLYNELYQFDEALKHSEKAIKKFPDEVVLSIDYASSLLNNRRYTECLAILENVEVLPYEGAWEAHHLFVRVQVYLAMENMKKGNYRKAVQYLESSRAYPEHLGTGEPYDPDFRLQDYLIALCYEKMNDKKRAEEFRKQIYNYTMCNWTDWGSQHYFGVLIFQHFGENDKAMQLLKDWEFLYPQNMTIQWYVAKFTGNHRKAREVERKRGDDPRFRMIVETVELIERTGDER